MDVEELSRVVIGKAIEVHRELGAGLLENVYQQCLAYELRQAGLNISVEMPMQAKYKELVFEAAYRLDIVVEDKLVLELKSVSMLTEVHKAQLLTYLKLSDKRLGLLINFNVPVLKQGIKRIANNL